MKRWYDYESGENKIGTIYFEPVIRENGTPSGEVLCTTEITYHSLTEQRDPRQSKLDDLEEHKWLAELFLAELVG